MPNTPLEEAARTVVRLTRPLDLLPLHVQIALHRLGELVGEKSAIDLANARVDSADPLEGL